MGDTATFDREASDALLQRMRSAFQGTVVVLMIDIGRRTGMLDALAKGPATPHELAERAGTHERHVREWLSALAVGEVVHYDAADGRFSLPPEHALWLTGTSHTNLAGLASMLTGLAHRNDDVIHAFQNGGGVHYDRYRPHFTHAMDSLGRARYDALLVNGYLPLAQGLPERLRAGVRAADVGCGTGHCLNLMAQAFPASTFVGFDIAKDAIELARAEADAMGLTNVTFEVADVLHLPTDPGFDVLFAFDAIHDQADPAGVLSRIRSALAPGGMLFMLDIKASSHLEDNLGDPANIVMYGISVMHCMQVSLAVGGAGLGTAWGTQLATRMLHEAGFDDVQVHTELPADPSNCIYVCRT